MSNETQILDQVSKSLTLHSISTAVSALYEPSYVRQHLSQLSILSDDAKKCRDYINEIVSSEDSNDKEEHLKTLEELKTINGQIDEFRKDHPLLYKFSQLIIKLD